ncbi:MAG: hypothetical protein Q9202_004223 [Teloschistes flavicans]
MAAGRSAATKLDWNKVTTSLGLKGSTAASLQAFKKRNDDARRKLAALRNLPQTVDFSDYRSTLSNTAVVDEIEGHFKTFKPKTYDVARQIKAIEAFEAQAMKGAEQTRLQVDREVKSLDKALRDIETARPFEDLTVVRFALLSLRLNPSRKKRSLMRNDVLLTIGESQDEVCAAAPEIEKRTEWLVSRGRWSVPGYKEKFGDLSVL